MTRLLSEADPHIPVRTAAFGTCWDTQTEAALRQLLENCFTGVRIVLAGPEAAVMRAAALAREHGASAEEIVPVADEAGDDGYVTQSAARSVFCASCQHVFDAVAAIGGVATCPGCGRDLIVDHRFSRPRVAYFGWPAGLADA